MKLRNVIQDQTSSSGSPANSYNLFHVLFCFLLILRFGVVFYSWVSAGLSTCLWETKFLPTYTKKKKKREKREGERGRGRRRHIEKNGERDREERQMGRREKEVMLMMELASLRQFCQWSLLSSGDLRRSRKEEEKKKNTINATLLGDQMVRTVNVLIKCTCSCSICRPTS